MTPTSPAIRNQLIQKALARNLYVKIQVTGYSMVPTIMPGATITIQPTCPSRPPIPGDIALVLTNPSQQPVLHRIIYATPYLTTTQGDSNLSPDPPTPNASILGIVPPPSRHAPWRQWILRHPTIAHKLNNLVAKLLQRLHKTP